MLTFFIQLIVDPSGPAIDLHVPLLIIIGTIPLRSVVQQYQTQFGMSTPQPSALPPPGPAPSAPSAPPMAAAMPDMSNLRECLTQYLISIFDKSKKYYKVINIRKRTLCLIETAGVYI